MSGANHTWRVTQGNRPNYDRAVIRDADDRPVATLWDREDAAALAWLIAAAPLLLEALSELVASVEAWNADVAAIIGRVPQTGMTLDKVRAALAAARGGE